MLFIAILFFAGAGALDRSSKKFFWFDEICTIAVASQPSLTGVWSALENAADSNPPPFYLVEKFFVHTTANPHVGFRLVSILAVLGTSIALFVFLRDRAGNAAAVLAGVLPLTTWFFTYASEARPYALAVCCLAWSLVIWRCADRRWAAALLALLLAAAASFHYYAVFGLVPFGVAEAARTMRTRRVRFPVWLAFLFGCLPILIFWPLLSHFRQYYGTNFWARQRLIGVPGIYDQLFNLPAWWGAGISIMLAIALLKSLPSGRKNDTAGVSVEISEEERWLILGFIALPVIGFALATVMHGSMTARYVLPAILGLSLALAILAAGHGRRVTEWVCSLVVGVFALQQVSYWAYNCATPRPASTEYDENATLRQMLKHSGKADLPVVVASGLSYVPMAYYDSVNPKIGFEYITEPAGAIAFARADSVDLGVKKLGLYLPLHVEDLSVFVKNHSRFLVYAGDSRWDWLPQRLSSGGFSVNPVEVRQSSNRVLYVVDRQTLSR